jgi:hypothetical protein
MATKDIPIITLNKGTGTCCINNEAHFMSEPIPILHLKMPQYSLHVERIYEVIKNTKIGVTAKIKKVPVTASYNSEARVKIHNKVLLSLYDNGDVYVARAYCKKCGMIISIDQGSVDKAIERFFNEYDILKTDIKSKL